MPRHGRDSAVGRAGLREDDVRRAIGRRDRVQEGPHAGAPGHPARRQDTRAIWSYPAGMYRVELCRFLKIRNCELQALLPSIKGIVQKVIDSFEE